MATLVAAYLRKAASVKPSLVSSTCSSSSILLFRRSSHHLDTSKSVLVCQHMKNIVRKKNAILTRRTFADKAKSSTKMEAQTVPADEGKKGFSVFEKVAFVAILYQIWKRFIREKGFSEDEDAYMEKFIERNKRVSDRADLVHITIDHEVSFMEDFITWLKKVTAGTDNEKENVTGQELNELGVSVYHLCQEFRKNARESVISKNNQHETKWGWPFHSRKVLLKPNDANVYDIVNDVIKKRGEEIICPIDGRKGTAYVNCLEGEDHVGKANIMLSYAWGNKIEDICNALEDHCHENGLDPKRTYIWICCLCNNQHRFDDVVPFEQLKETFRSKVEGIGNVIPLFAPWDAPHYTQRLWCVFELSTAQNADDCKVTIRMPPVERRLMFDALKDGNIEKLYKILSEIDVSKAGATKEEDQRNILKLVEERGGAAVVNNEARRRCRTWVHQTINELLDEQERKVGKNLDLSAHRDLADLRLNAGKIYHDEGRWDLAMMQYQKALSIAKKLKGKDHLLSTIYYRIGSLIVDEGVPWEALLIYNLARKALKKETSDPNDQKELRETILTIAINELQAKYERGKHLSTGRVYSLKHAWKEISKAKNRMEASGLDQKDPQLYSRILTEYGLVASERGDFKKAEEALKLALFSALTDSNQNFKEHLHRNETGLSKFRHKISDFKRNQSFKKFSKEVMLEDGNTFLKFLDEIPESEMNTNRNIAGVLFTMSKHFDRKGDKATATKLIDYALPSYRLTYGQYHPALIETFRIGAKMYHYSGDVQGRNFCCDKALTVLNDLERSSGDWNFKKKYLEELRESGQDEWMSLITLRGLIKRSSIIRALTGAPRESS